MLPVPPPPPPPFPSPPLPSLLYSRHWTSQMGLTVHQLSTSSPTMDLHFLWQPTQLHSALVVHVSTHSESLAVKHSSIQWLWLPEMFWEWELQVHLWLLVCCCKYSCDYWYAGIARSSKHHMWCLLAEHLSVCPQMMAYDLQNLHKPPSHLRRLNNLDKFIILNTAVTLVVSLFYTRVSRVQPTLTMQRQLDHEE